MNWVKMPDGKYYTFAPYIQKFAEEHGYKAPCEADGTKHPGTDCNAKMRAVIKDAGLRRIFTITPESVIDVYIDNNGFNSKFLQWLIDEGIVSDAYKKHKVIQLYSREAVDAILSVMLNYTLRYIPSRDKNWKYEGTVVVEYHNFELKKNKPKASLFKQ